MGFPMGLNKVEGEILAGLGRGKPADLEKWACIPDLFKTALAGAYEAFDAAGAPEGYEIGPTNLLIQEFHLASKLVFTFWMPISGQDTYFHYTFDLPPNLIAELAVTGRWPAIYALHNLRAN
jgi:hypothetical protein